jgi:hypothetical protein
MGDVTAGAIIQVAEEHDVIPDVVQWAAPHLDAVGVAAIEMFMGGVRDEWLISELPASLEPSVVGPACMADGQPWDAVDLALIALRVTAGCGWRWLGAHYLLCDSEYAPSIKGQTRPSGSPYSGSDYAQIVRDLVAARAGVDAKEINPLLDDRKIDMTVSRAAKQVFGVSPDRSGTIGPGASSWITGDLVHVGTRTLIRRKLDYYLLRERRRPATAEGRGAAARLLRRLVGREESLGAAGLRIIDLTDGRVEVIFDGQRSRIPVTDFEKAMDGYTDVASAALAFVAQVPGHPDAAPNGATDVTVASTARREQAWLRRLLIGGRFSAQCDICTREFPVELLVAAHIKRRGACTDKERRDPNVAMLACTFGCDAMFELGQITVLFDGTIAPGDDQLTGAGHAAKYVDVLTGRICAAHKAASEPYFSWHRHQIGGLSRNSVGRADA